MAQVKYEFKGDSSHLNRTVDQVGSKIKGLASGAVMNLRSAVVGAFGGAALVAGAKSIIEYGDSLDKSAKRLGVTTDYVQVLRRAARDMKKDFTEAGKAMDALAESAQDAVNGNKDKGHAFKSLGISPEEVKHLNPEQRMTRVMAGGLKLPRNEALAHFSTLFGSANAGDLLSAGTPSLANPKATLDELKEKGQYTSGDEIEKLALMQDAIEDTTSILKAKLVPIVVIVGDVLAKLAVYAQRVIDVFSIFANKEGKHDGFSNVETPLVDWFVDNAKFMMKVEKATNEENAKRAKGADFIGPIQAPMRQSEMRDLMAQKDAIKNPDGVGSIIQQFTELKKEWAIQDADRVKTQSARAAERAADRAKLNGPINLTNQSVSKTPALADGKENPWRNIGGLEFVDTQYAVKQINQDMLAELRLMRGYLSKMGQLTSKNYDDPFGQ